LKPIMITLLYLTSFGDVEIATPFEINTSCYNWYEQNVTVNERKKRKLFSSHVYHTYKGKQTIGYICSDNVPQ